MYCINLIIPVVTANEAFDACLASVSGLEPQPDRLIIVVDGADAQAIERAGRLNATVLTTPIAGGPARARNLAAASIPVSARDAEHDLLFFVDSDVAVPSDAIGIIRRTFAENPGLHAMIGSYDDAPGQSDFLSQYRNLLHHYIHQTSSSRASSFWAGCGVIRRDTFFQHGPFNVDLMNPCVEDIELGYHLAEAGCSIRLEKILQAKHYKRYSPWSMIHTDFFHRALPWTRLIVAHKHLGSDLNLRWSARFSALLSVGLCASMLLLLLFPVVGFLIALACAVGLLSLNLPFYRFLARKRSWQFSLAAMPWHWLYFLYSLAGFLVGVITYPFVKNPFARPSDHRRGEQRLASKSLST